MDEINEQTYRLVRLYRIVADEDGRCGFIEMTGAAPINVVAAIKRVFDEMNVERNPNRVYTVEPAYQEWQE